MRHLIGAAAALLCCRLRRFRSGRMPTLVFTERLLYSVLDLTLHVAVVLASLLRDDPLNIGRGSRVVECLSRKEEDGGNQERNHNISQGARTYSAQNRRDLRAGLRDLTRRFLR